MSRGNWNRIKQSKFFYVRVYRKLLTVIIASTAFNVILCAALIYSFLHIPLRDFYATSGVVPPIQLTPLDAPNNTSESLLPPDPINDDNNRVIPE